MTFAIILAGGKGVRLGASVPKQFIVVEGKPILVHTLEKFQTHPLIDAIAVVCIQGWEDVVREYAVRFSITKLSQVVTGGETALESIRRGINSLDCKEDDIVVIHDSVRPLVDEDIISNVIRDTAIYGGAISSVPLSEHVFTPGEEPGMYSYIPKEHAWRAVSPHAYTYRKIISAFKKAEETGIGMNSAFIGTMMVDLGEKVVLSKGSERNIKITDPNDLAFFNLNLHQCP